MYLLVQMPKARIWICMCVKTEQRIIIDMDIVIVVVHFPKCSYSFYVLPQGGMCSVYLQDTDKVVSISSEHLEPVTPTKNNKVHCYFI